MQWIDDMEKRAKMPFEKLMRETKDRWIGLWRRLVHETNNPRIEDTWLKTRLDKRVLE